MGVEKEWESQAKSRKRETIRETRESRQSGSFQGSLLVIRDDVVRVGKAFKYAEESWHAALDNRSW